MADIFKYLGIAVVVAFADALICLGFTFTLDVDDNEKWLPTLVFNCLGFVACLTILIGKEIK